MLEKLTLDTKISYRKRPNPRAFKIWNSEVYKSIMIHAADIKAKVIEAAGKTQTSISELPSTTIDTELLYLLTDGYLDLYRKLLSENLLKTGNIRTNPNIH